MTIRSIVCGDKSMKKGSLEKIMAEMAGRLDATQPMSALAKSSRDIVEDALDQMPTDPILSALHKEYQEAKNAHRQLVQSNGIDDPMTEVAADMLDSARSAVQTRMLELKEWREQEIKEISEVRQRRQKAEFDAARLRSFFKKRKQEHEDDLFYWIVVMYWLSTQTLKLARKKLSAANDFALVSISTNDKRYA